MKVFLILPEESWKEHLNVQLFGWTVWVSDIDIDQNCWVERNLVAEIILQKFTIMVIRTPRTVES